MSTYEIPQDAVIREPLGSSAVKAKHGLPYQTFIQMPPLLFDTWAVQESCLTNLRPCPPFMIGAHRSALQKLNMVSSTRNCVSPSTVLPPLLRRELKTQALQPSASLTCRAHPGRQGLRAGVHGAANLHWEQVSGGSFEQVKPQVLAEISSWET